METILDKIIDNLAVSFLAVLLLLKGFFLYGLPFLKKLIDIGQEYREKSNLIKDEYIALLESENGRLKKRLEKLQNKNKERDDLQ